ARGTRDGLKLRIQSPGAGLMSVASLSTQDSALRTQHSRRVRKLLGRWALTGAILAWFAILILVPTVALVRQALAGGLRPFLDALSSPDVRRAFGLSLGITVVATAINTVFGLAFAMVLVRHDFRGRTLADGLVDLPFAVSPVVAGLMLIVL